MPNYERKTSDIFISDQFRNILEIFKDKSEVAQLLLYRRINKENLVDNHINYICVSVNDPTKISYLTSDRIEVISKSFTDDYWTSPKRFACKPGAFLNKIFKNISPKEVENFANLYKSFATKTDIEFKIVTGNDIVKYYHQDSYYNQNGTLGSSCMKSDSCQDYFDIYTQNDMVSMVIMLAANKKLLGRALLWQIGDEKVMDRIYTIQDDTYFHHMAKWATDNGIIYKAYQNWQTCQTFSDGTNEIEKKFSLKLKVWNLQKYPYIDSFKWLDMNNGLLTNYQPEHFKSHDESGNFRTLTTTCGGYELGDYLGFCEIDREYSHIRDIVEIDGKTYSTRHCNYSDTLNCYILRSESTYSNRLEDYVYSDFSRMDTKLVERRLKHLLKMRGETPKNKSELTKLFESFMYSPWTINETA